MPGSSKTGQRTKKKGEKRHTYNRRKGPKDLDTEKKE